MPAAGWTAESPFWNDITAALPVCTGTHALYFPIGEGGADFASFAIR